MFRFFNCFRESNYKCVQTWGMTAGSALSIIAIFLILLDCVRFKQLRSFTRRPVAPLLFRAVCNLVFCGQFIFALLFLKRSEGATGGKGEEYGFGPSICRNLAFITQVNYPRPCAVARTGWPALGGLTCAGGAVHAHGI